ncbi:hypothetical protein BD413DRAFT_51504 [Trametes elegans]|nr:hypothetical protein BD413DRAFT_51504 [Trametes elegans]
MAANGQAASQFACKCLNIRIHAQPTQDTPPPAEVGFNPVYVGEQGIRVAHTEVTLRSRSKPVPIPDSPTEELTRYTTIACLVCGVPTYRVLQRITPDLINEVGPVLPTDDWVEKEMIKSTTGWVEVYQGCLTNEEISQAEASPMYSRTFSIVLPGPKPPSASPVAEEGGSAEVPNARGPSEHGKTHLPELPPLFLPPPFTPSHVVFSHFSSLATEQSQKLRDEAEEYIAKVTQQKVAEIRKTEAAIKQEVNLVWTKFREAVLLLEQNGLQSKTGLPLGRRASVSGHARSVSSPAPGVSASVRINSFVPTPSHLHRHPSGGTAPAPSALSASLKTSGFHHPDAQRQTNGSAPSARRSLDLPPHRSRASPSRSSVTRVDSPSTASSRTVAIPFDPEASIREAHRREMDESKDVATSFRYVMDLESQMEEHRLQEEEELTSPPVASTSQAAAASSAAAAASRGRSPRVHKSAIKHAKPAEDSKSSKSEDTKTVNGDEHKDKGKRKVTFDVKPEVAIIKDDNAGSERSRSSTTNEDPIFDMDNESEQAAATRAQVPVEPPRNPPAVNPERTRPPPRHSRGQSASYSGLPPMLSSLRPASLPAPSSMRPPMRHPVSPTEPSERTRTLRESLLGAEANSTRPETVDGPVEIQPRRRGGDGADDGDDDEPVDPREEEILRLVAASTPSHRSAWKKNSKAWQLFLSRRERRANDIGPETISEEGNYHVLDDFGQQPHQTFNGVADSDVTDDDTDGEQIAYCNSLVIPQNTHPLARSLLADDKWATDNHGIAQSLPIPIGPLGQHKPFAYQPKTSLSDRPGLLVPPLRNASVSAASLRRASYAERDRVRKIDPGALDFAVDEDEDGAEGDDVESDPETGGKARQRALRILKAREELPAAGEY